MEFLHKHDVNSNCQIYNTSPQTVQYLYLFCLDALGLLADCFPFEGGNIASVNGVSIAIYLNGNRAIIYWTYHMFEGFCDR